MEGHIFPVYGGVAADSNGDHNRFESEVAIWQGQ